MSSSSDERGDARHLALQECLSCHMYQHYPRELCRRCHSRDLRWVKASGRGTVYSHTTMHRTSAAGGDAPRERVLALVELEEGPRVLSTLVLPDEISPRIGMAVEAWLEVAPEQSQRLRFRPVQT